MLFGERGWVQSFSLSISFLSQFASLVVGVHLPPQELYLDRTAILGEAVAPENFEGDPIKGHLQLMILNFSSTPVKREMDTRTSAFSRSTGTSFLELDNNTCYNFGKESVDSVGFVDFGFGIL
ncbi:uncharacterized protein [Pyrus communis]|uniref:uncharacterized protein n=1 Tax=Pyrus communis TaxID=23211 RepID=UPI0035BF79AB